MGYAFFNIRVKTEDHSFVQTPHQALEVLRNMLSHDPRFSLYEMEITEVAQRRPILTQEDVNAWNATVDDDPRNVFEHDGSEPVLDDGGRVIGASFDHRRKRRF